MPETPTARVCPVCRRAVTRFEPGPRQRPDARCGGCQSLERHRFLAVLLTALAPTVTAAGLLLDIAPTRQTTRLFQSRLAPKKYVRMDFDPGADGRDVDVQASLTDLPFRSGSADVVICYHVLEHIPDDASAMAELRRVLAADGVAFVQVPFSPGRPTDEDPSASVEERIARFGQADHVRQYGDDLEDRLRAAGLALRRITPAGTVGPRGVTLYRLEPDEAVWLVWPDGSAAAAAFDEDALRAAMAEQVAADADRQPPAPAAAPASVARPGARRRHPLSARIGWAARHPVEAARRVARKLGR